MRKLLFIILLLSVCLVGKAQTFYEVNYIEDDEEYVGLMIYYSDENCKMRLISSELLENDEVYESEYINYTEGKEDDDDVNMMVYYPVEKNFPAFVWYWEADDASDMNDAPYVTYNLKKSKDYFESKYFREISITDMDENYVSQFYGEEEPEYHMMVNAIKLLHQQGTTSASTSKPNDIEVTVDDPVVQNNYVDGQPDADAGTNVAPGGGSGMNSLTMGGNSLMGNSLANQATMHMIIVANTTVSDIGAACKRDLNNLSSEFGGIAKVLGMNYDLQTLSGKTYSKESLVNLINGFNPDKNDVVIFAYSGHGFRFDNQSDYYPNIDLSPTSYDNPAENYVAVSDIYKAIVGKGARLNLIFSDCCNTKIGATMPLVNTNTLFSRANNNFDRTKLQRLFMDASGSMIATAASPGEMSWCGVNGGFFTLSFLECLRNQISALSTDTPSWETLISNTIASAAKKSSNNSNCQTQNGMKMVRVQ